MHELVVWLLMVVLLVVPLWRICARAGFAPVLALVAAVPFLGFLIVAAVLGFADWPRLAHRAPQKRP